MIMRSISMFLAGLLAAVSVFSMNSYATNEDDVAGSVISDSQEESGTWGDNLSWKIEEGILTISGNGEMEDSSSYSYPWYDTWNDSNLFSKVVIEKGVTSIAKCAFNNGTTLRSIEEVVIADTVTKIGSGAFMYLKIGEVKIPESVSEIGEGAFEGSAYTTSFTVDKNNSFFKDCDGVLYSKDGKTLVAFPGARTGSYTVEAGTEIIGDRAFEKANISEIVLPNTLKEIRTGAFTYSAIESVDIPEGVELISNWSFTSCTNLKKVSIPSTVKRWGVWYVFGDIKTLEEIKMSAGLTVLPKDCFMGCDNLKKVDIGEGIKIIPEGIFSMCSNLSEVHIPHSVETIEKGAFRGININAVVYYNGTKEEWKKIDLAIENTIDSKNIVFKEEETTDTDDDSEKNNNDVTDNSNEEEKQSDNTSEDSNPHAKYGLDDKYVPDGYEDKSGSPMIMEGLDCKWNEVNGKLYWYEGGIKQGTYYDTHGVMGDGTIRGREIYDSESDGWYWLDSVYDGAKAVGKEVWVPYIYQQEAEWDDETLHNIANESDEGMADLVYSFMKEKKGKWVRYDENGKMLKGWVTIDGALADLYPEQAGNTYYYDSRTGLMAKGEVTIGGQTYQFDEITGALR